jgi:hypothetical protein
MNTTPAAMRITSNASSAKTVPGRIRRPTIAGDGECR